MPVFNALPIGDASGQVNRGSVVFWDGRWMVTSATTRPSVPSPDRGICLSSLMAWKDATGIHQGHSEALLHQPVYQDKGAIWGDYC